MKQEYLPILLSGIVVVFGINFFLSVRDSKLFKKLDERRQQQEFIYQQLEVTPYSDPQAPQT
tara:strand:- start:587 stop:772 length:186 start_codon:yes stop_codon:yes gene_type:complete